MLITTELVRDVLCNEVIEVNKLIDVKASDVTSDIKKHISNMVNILMSQQDFVHVPVDAWTPELTEVASKIASQRGAINV